MKNTAKTTPFFSTIFPTKFYLNEIQDMLLLKG